METWNRSEGLYEGKMKMRNIRLVCILIVVPALLLIPYFAMKFGDEVNWTAIDFIVMGFMLLVTGLAIEVALRIVKRTWMKVARSEEHTSELQSQSNLVCRLLLEKKK